MVWGQDLDDLRLLRLEPQEHALTMLLDVGSLMSSDIFLKERGPQTVKPCTEVVSISTILDSPQVN